jgi:LPXTG-motif cell wall-anchored protein
VAAHAEGRLAEVVRDVEPTLRRWGHLAVAAVVALARAGAPWLLAAAALGLAAAAALLALRRRKEPQAAPRR